MPLDKAEETKDLGAVLRLEKVGVTYPGGNAALQPLSLELRDGEVTVLLGQSGAGKSTLLRTLNHLTPPSSGQVFSQSVGPLTGASSVRAHRRKTAMVFQQHQLIGRLNALQNVLTARLGHYSFWRTLFPLPDVERRLALLCLERVGLLDRALSRCDRMSGGQQQRVGIARALAQEPHLILADEPVASLDPGTSEKVLSQLRQICREDGTPVVISLHQLEYARTYADRVIGLSEGRLVFDDTPDKLDDAALAAIYGNWTEKASVRHDKPPLQGAA